MTQPRQHCFCCRFHCVLFHPFYFWVGQYRSKRVKFFRNRRNKRLWISFRSAAGTYNTLTRDGHISVSFPCSPMPLVRDHQIISTIFFAFFFFSFSVPLCLFLLLGSDPGDGGKVIVVIMPRSLIPSRSRSLSLSCFFLISHSTEASMFVSFANLKKSYRARKPDE